MVMKASFRRSLWVLVSLGCVGFAAGACGSDDGDVDDPSLTAGAAGVSSGGKGGSSASGKGGADAAGQGGSNAAGQGSGGAAGTPAAGNGGTNAAGTGGSAGNGTAGTGGSSGSDAGTGGSSGSDAGTGGSSAGTGGSNAGTGGSNAGTGGSNAGTGGSSAGTGGSSAGTGGSSGSSAGTGGSNAGTGGSSAGTGGSSAGTGGSGGLPDGGKFRIMASNLTSGNKQTYEEPGRRILRAMKPDVILIQEFSVLSGTIDSLVDDVCGTECDYQRGTGNIPNGVISRFPILEKGEWQDDSAPDREFEWARIDIPGDRDLLAVSVHLLTTDSKRPPETNQLVGYIQAALKPTDYLVLGGDFNTSSYDDPAFATLSVILSTAAPYPADQSGNTGTNTNRLMDGKSKPYDHVISDATLRAFEIPVVIGASTFPSGFIVDTRAYNPIADLAPALVDDSGALNMQHMGVVRDFVVPLN
jgi:endonuclease/exonuclease/phosphatase family metal-dependent hydrolase